MSHAQKRRCHASPKSTATLQAIATMSRIHYGEMPTQDMDASFPLFTWMVIDPFLSTTTNFLLKLFNPSHIGISQVRLAASGKPLPNPVKVADAVHAPRSKPSNGYLTTLAAVWTQFVLHDVSHPITYTGTFLFEFHPVCSSPYMIHFFLL